MHAPTTNEIANSKKIIAQNAKHWRVPAQANEIIFSIFSFSMRNWLGFFISNDWTVARQTVCSQPTNKQMKHKTEYNNPRQRNKIETQQLDQQSLK